MSRISLPGLPDTPRLDDGEFRKLFEIDGPTRSGFETQRKYWESDKDDPSTFGGYISKRRSKKKKRR